MFKKILSPRPKKKKNRSGTVPEGEEQDVPSGSTGGASNTGGASGTGGACSTGGDTGTGGAGVVDTAAEAHPTRSELKVPGKQKKTGGLLKKILSPRPKRKENRSQSSGNVLEGDGEVTGPEGEEQDREKLLVPRVENVSSTYCAGPLDTLTESPRTNSELLKAMRMHHCARDQRRAVAVGATAGISNTGGFPRHIAEGSDYSVPFDLVQQTAEPPVIPSRMAEQMREGRPRCGISPVKSEKQEQDSGYADPWDSSKFLQKIPHKNWRMTHGGCKNAKQQKQQQPVPKEDQQQQVPEEEKQQSVPEEDQQQPVPEEEKQQSVLEEEEQQPVPEEVPKLDSISVNTPDHSEETTSSVAEASPSNMVDYREKTKLPGMTPPRPMSIDVSIPLEDQVWYHGDIDILKAEDILKEEPNFSFLVRKCQGTQLAYAISIRNRDGIGKGFFHLALVYESKPKPGYVLADVSRPFRSVAECISNYINMEWIEIPEFKPMCLKYPVIRRDCSGVRV